MSWARFSLRHPVPAIVFFLVALVVGFVSYTRLAVDLYPAMEFPMAVVVAEYEGAGPQEVESLVTRPLEEALGTTPGLKKIRSWSSEGTSFVLAEFNWGTDMDFATLQMRERIDRVRGFLPDEVKSPLVFKMDPQSIPVLVIGLTGSQDLAELKRIAEDDIKPILERQDGVASVNVTGGVDREIQVLVDPARLHAAGVSIPQVAQALATDNLNLPGGDVREGQLRLLVRSIGQFRSVDDIRDLRLLTPRGQVVRLGDIAEVKDTFAEARSKTWVNGSPSVSLSVLKQSGANSVQVARRVKETLEELSRTLPGGIQAHVLLDQSRYILDSLNGVRDSAVQGGLLAIVILYLFLRHFRATLAVGLAIPISIVVTFGALYLGGVTLNMMSLGGLSMGVGMLVDNAIVVLENIFRHKQKEGKDPHRAAEEGAGEVTLAVVASTLTTVCVFLPIVFIQGLAKQYFQELALAVTFSLMASLAVSLTLVPLMASRLLADRPGRTPGEPPRLSRWIGRVWDRLDAAYARLLAWALQHRKSVVAIAVGAFVLAGALVPLVGVEFIPKMDTSEFQVSIELPNGTRLEETERVAHQVEAIVRTIPEVRTIYTSVGSSGSAFDRSTASNVAGIYALLVRPHERDRSLDEIMDEVRTRTRSIAGATIRVQLSGALGPGGSPVEVQIKGEDLDVLKSLAARVEAEVARVPGTREVKSSVTRGLPEVQVVVDRRRAADLGLSAAQIAQVVQTAVRGTVATRYRVGGNEYDIRVRAAEPAREDLEALGNLYVPTPRGEQVPLREVAQLVRATGPTSVNREDQARVVSVTAQLFGRDLGSAMAEIRQRLAALPLPPGYSIDYGGQSREMADAFSGLSQALALATVLVYLVMAAQFESFLHPLVIMFSVPFAFAGAVYALAVTGRSLDIAGMLGVIMLVGIVVNNAIVLIDYVNQLRRRGLTREEAILRAGPTRLRPVLMTTLTTVLGLLPLALGLGEGTDQQAPMATVVMGGLIFSTLLTLVFVPTVYTILEDALQARWVRRLLPVRPRPAAHTGD
ncbi:efflux RND transporter permease subunit [Caldinitratiruptor microaerophilus]|uniref:Multidrug ABC transporter n=1 Tax=Caldinitratiruptor microaerophilus TaxID=671077 RepID=A0AA35CJ27_9FIRM|nr:efflux RND transporter permease subunit [Caldinitratiruptor microaerophilus]BDG59273.1 multidrug ABC transporter [Caldinitratiruptor microaerophilus]